MMKADKVFWGIIFIFIGGIFLLENFGFIDFSWRHVWRFWPVLLIIAGVNIVFSHSKSTYRVLIIAIITLLSLIFLTYKGLDKTIENANSELSFSDDENQDWDNEEQSATNSYQEDFDAKYKFATLNIQGGAGTFDIAETTDKLFNARIKENSAKFYLRKTDSDSTVVLNFNSKNNNGQYSIDKNLNKANIQLNSNPIWDVNLKMGAGKANFDFSELKLKILELKGGAAAFNITLGSLYPAVKLNAETGVSEINISIPEQSGCQIITAVGLSLKDFNGFTKIRDNIYQTPNYNTAAHKIEISLKGGLSDFNVDRY